MATYRLKMTDNVIEIISFIIKSMLENDEPLDQEEVITDLIEAGYELEDIDKAFALILSNSELIEDVDNANFNGSQDYNRVFSISEKMYLPEQLQGLIYRLLVLNVLSPKESESLIGRTVQNVYKGSTQPEDLWKVLNDVVDDEQKLRVISKNIPEFNDYIQQKYKYIN